MHASRIFTLVAVVGMVGFPGVSSQAEAVDLNHSGTICRNYNASEVTDIDYVASGARNVNANQRFVICPLIRSPNSANNATVYIDGVHSGTQTTNCTLYSHDANGTLLGSLTTTVTQAGFWERLLTLPSGQAPFYANLSLLCYLPGVGTSLILGATVVQ